MTDKALKFWKLASWSGVPFGLVLGLFLGFSGGAVQGVIGGVIAGILFGSAVAFFAGSKTVKKQVTIEVPEDERRVFDGPANHFKRFEGRGGWLYLTDKTLYFQPHSFNFQRSRVRIPLLEIFEAVPSNTWGVIPNGLTVKAKHGQTHRFVVYDHKGWSTKIQSQISSGVS